MSLAADELPITRRCRHGHEFRRAGFRLRLLDFRHFLADISLASILIFEAAMPKMPI